MHPHPDIQAQIARERQQDLRRSFAATRRSPRTQAARTASLASLVGAARGGDERAWEALVERFTPMLRAVVTGYRLGAADADDVVQSSWASAVAHIHALRESDAIGGWLAAITRREALRIIHQRRRELVVEDLCPADELDHPAPEQVLLDGQRREAVRKAIANLPRRQRALLGALLTDASPSYAEMSARMDVPIGSIGPTRERALSRLRRDRELAVLR